MSQVSTASIWMRLPDLICSLICWLLLSREVLPRLGPAVIAEPSGAVGGRFGADGLVDGVQQRPAAGRPDRHRRPDHLRADRAGGHLGRLTPAALAIFSAAFTLGIQPTGLIAVAALVAGGRPILRIIMRRRRSSVLWPLLAPLLAAGTVILAVVFADQTIRNGAGGHQDSHRHRAQPGVVHREPAATTTWSCPPWTVRSRAGSPSCSRRCACSRRCS